MNPSNPGVFGSSQKDWPAHLRDDAPFKQCSVCGRKSWDNPTKEKSCGMPQPNGQRCQGTLRPVQ